ncbi:MAG: FG-GAP repeat protein, partial [Spirochaetia bacterium]
SINSGASFSNIQSVRIYNSISGATKMSFTGDISPTVAERAYAASYDVTLTAGEAVKNITGTFKDVAGNQLVQTVSIKLNTFAVSYTSASGNGEMGYSVGINQSGTVAVSGSPYRTWYQPITGGFLVRTEVGAFQIFRKSSGIWAVDGGLNHTGLNYAHMGYSVSVDASGTYITVGAPQDGASTNSPYGKVYRYRYSSGWTLYQTMAEDGSHNGNGQTVLDTGTYFYYRYATLTNNVRRNDGLATTYNAQGFYKDMDASGATGSDYMAVGAPFDVSSQGRVYMCNPALGSPVAKAASDAAANALFGRTVAISRDHNTLVVSDNLGDVYIFQGGVQVQKIPPQGGSQYFGLGLAVSDDGTTIVIGQPAYNSWLGAVYLYVRPPSQPSTWSLVQVYTPPAAVAGDNFGHSVAVSGDGSTIVAGAPTASTTGAAVVYILE